MNPWRWVDPRVQKVKLAQVQAYFALLGWVIVPNANPNFIRYERAKKGKGETFYRVIPSAEDYSSFPQDVAELITTLSELENRHPVAVLDDILRAGPSGSGENGLAAHKPAARRKMARSKS